MCAAVDDEQVDLIHVQVQMCIAHAALQTNTHNFTHLHRGLDINSAYKEIFSHNQRDIAPCILYMYANTTQSHTFIEASISTVPTRRSSVTPSGICTKGASRMHPLP